MMTADQLTGQSESHLIEVMVGQKNFSVHPYVKQDLLALKQSADAAGFNFNIASGFRSFEKQLSIWNKKMSGELLIRDENNQPLDSHQLTVEQKVRSILLWSALPGASRHHWGTDFDVFDRNALPPHTGLKLEPWEYLHDHQHSFYLWLKENIEKHGFFFPYPQGGSGVAFEPWHISHRVTAKQCLAALTQPLLAKQLESAPILGKECVHKQLTEIYNQYIVNIGGQ